MRRKWIFRVFTGEHLWHQAKHSQTADMQSQDQRFALEPRLSLILVLTNAVGRLSFLQLFLESLVEKLTRHHFGCAPSRVFFSIRNLLHPPNLFLDFLWAMTFLSLSLGYASPSIVLSLCTPAQLHIQRSGALFFLLIVHNSWFLDIIFCFVRPFILLNVEHKNVCLLFFCIIQQAILQDVASWIGDDGTAASKVEFSFVA